MSGKIKFLCLPLGPCTDMYFRAAPSQVPATGTRVPHPKCPSTYPRMRPNFRSWLRYNRETRETDFSPRKPVPSYGLAPVRPPFRPLFRHSPDTKWARMRPDFRSCFRYERETMRPISATKNIAAATIAVSPATKTPPRPLSSQLRKSARMRPPFRSWLRYNRETTKTMASPSLPAIGSGLSRWNYHGLCGRVVVDVWARSARPGLLFQLKHHTMALIPTGKVSEK